MTFNDEDILQGLDRCAPSGFDDLPFGVIKMALDGTTIAYSASESRRSGLSIEKVVGKNFFLDVAPCMNNYLVAQRLLDECPLDATIDYVLTFRMKPTPVRLRLLRGVGAPHTYILVQRLT